MKTVSYMDDSARGFRQPGREKPMTNDGVLHRLARFCYRRRRLVLAGWLVALVLVSFLSKAAGGKDSTKFSLPGTESQQAVDISPEL